MLLTAWRPKRSVPVRVRFHVTSHFAQRTQERNLSVEEAKEAVRHPTQRRKLNNVGGGGMLYRFERTGATGTLVVIAEIRREEAHLVTAYHEDRT
jgi:hypothetical protein